jgi:Raf kinase inhibitor-like YbhB/YbcL family protein
MRSRLVGLAPLILATPAFAGGFIVTSPAFPDGGTVPPAQFFDQDGCTGANQSPALAWSGAPAGTKSFAVTMFDPDAPGGKGWWHWIVFDIPPTVHSLPAGAGDEGSGLLPPGAKEGRNDFGLVGYGGPCPPAGAPPHRYEITVYSVNVAKLPLDAGASGASVSSALRLHTLATAEIMGHAFRPQ